MDSLETDDSSSADTSADVIEDSFTGNPHPETPVCYKSIASSYIRNTPTSSNGSDRVEEEVKNTFIKVVSPTFLMGKDTQVTKKSQIFYTPRGPKSSFSSKCSDESDVIEDSEDEEIHQLSHRKESFSKSICTSKGIEQAQQKKKNLLQMTIMDSFKKHLQDKIETASSPVTQLKAEQTERTSLNEGKNNVQLIKQKRKVSLLREEALKAQNMLMTLNLDGLPDKGKLLTEKHEELTKQLKEQQKVLNTMLQSEPIEEINLISPNKEGNVDKQHENIGNFNEDKYHYTSSPLQNDYRPYIKWEQLEGLSNNVQPNTFGKQALATFNEQKALTMDRLEQLHGSLATRPHINQLETDPKGLKVELMAHQKHALAWMLWREKQKPSGGILADDMGLGKTLTMISLILKTREIECEEDEDDSDEENKRGKTKYDGGTLVICPASLLQQWEGEVKSKVKRGYLGVEVHHGAKRETKAKSLAQHSIVVTTYSIVMKDYEKNSALFRIKWRRIILDEAHQIRNHKSQTSIAIFELSARSRWALSGTPVHNKELDLYSLLKYLRCSPFDDLSVWKRWVANKSVGGQDRLNTVMSSLLLRRTKAELVENGSLTSLPDRKWELIEVKLDDNEMKVYRKIMVFSRTLFAQFLHQRAEKTSSYQEDSEKMLTDPNSEYYKMHKKLVRLNKMKNIKSHDILMLLLRLRQICCHTSLITKMLDTEEAIKDELEGEEPIEELNILEQLDNLNLEDNEAPVVESGELVGLAEASRGVLNSNNPIFSEDRQSSKLTAVLKVLKDLVLPSDDKAIVVSQWTSMLRLIGIHLKKEGIAFNELNGSVPVQKRMKIVDDFNNASIKTKILLLSLTAGGVGLNLVGANHLLLLDLHWNPQLEMQAQDRIYRFGQKKTVNIYKFMTVDTIEERIKALQDKKLAMAESMLTGAAQTTAKLSLDDLKMIFNM